MSRKNAFALGSWEVLEIQGLLTRDLWKGDVISALAQASSKECLHHQNNLNVLH